MKKLSTLAIIVGAAALVAVPVSVHLSPQKNVVLSLDRADARIGRPATPRSVAGVNRRVDRRTVRRGVAVGAAGAAAGAYYYGYGRTACGYSPYPPCY